jgi:hypothetical protein
MSSTCFPANVSGVGGCCLAFYFTGSGNSTGRLRDPCKDAGDQANAAGGANVRRRLGQGMVFVWRERIIEGKASVDRKPLTTPPFFRRVVNGTGLHPGLRPSAFPVLARHRL